MSDGKFTPTLNVQEKPDTVARLKALCDKCELPYNDEGYTQLVANALRLYEDVITQHEAGNILLVEKTDGTVIPYKVFE